MAKIFYTLDEAAEKLGRTSDEIKELVQSGQLREFRDGGKTNYKVDEVDALLDQAGESGLDLAGQSGSGIFSAAASASGEIVLEPADETGFDLAASGTEIRLEEADASGTALGGSTFAASEKAKEGTVVPSVGVNVFDDDELDEMVDPLAQTAVTDVGGLGLEGSGSGSGILDLTRESDDTSLGAELLDEIYSGEGEGESGDAAVEMGEATRAGLDDAVPEETEPDSDEVFKVEEDTAPVIAAPIGVTQAPTTDALASALTAGMFVAVLAMWVGGLAAASLVRGVVPSILEVLYNNLAIFTGGVAGVAIIASAVTYLLAKKSN